PAPRRIRGHAGMSALALTMGEPAGIGGEIALQAWLRRDDGIPPFFAIDDAARLDELARRCGWAVPLGRIAAPEEAEGVFDRALPVLEQRLAAASVPGKPDAANAPSVIAANDRAV